MSVAPRDLMRWQFDLTWSLLDLHLERLKPEDFLWEPAARCWTVQPDGEGWVPEPTQLQASSHDQKARARSPSTTVDRLETVRVGRFHLPQRPAEPGPRLLEVPNIRADRAVGQPR